MSQEIQGFDEQAVRTALDGLVATFQAMADGGKATAMEFVRLKGSLRKALRALNPRKPRGLRRHIRRAKAAGTWRAR